MEDRGRAHGRAVSWDSYCGEPVEWVAVGEPVIGSSYGPTGSVAFTHRLTVAEAIEVYGEIQEWVVGPARGFRRATFGEKTFSYNGLGGASPDAAVVVVEDPDLEWRCPQCDAIPGEPCVGGARKHKARRWDTLYRAFSEEINAQRVALEKLREQNDLLDRQVHSLRQAARNSAPICSRPTRAGTPCQANAMTYPVAIESCRIHLTEAEKANLT